MYPALLLWQPKIAQSLLQYRINNVKTAETKVRSPKLTVEFSHSSYTLMTYPVVTVLAPHFLL